MPLADDLIPPEVRRWLLTGLDHTILVTDANLNVVGDPITTWTSLDVTLRYNEPGSGQFATPGFPWIREQLQAGSRLVLIRNRQVLIAGPYEESLYERSDDGANAGDGTLTVHFADDLATIAARLTYPNPAVVPASQDIDNWTFTGNAEAALRALVNLNAGPGALLQRRIPGLVLGDLAGVGSTITVKAERMEPLGDVMRRAAAAGGNLGFRTRQDGNQIKFEVYAPPDVSGQVRISFGLGNLRYVGYERKSPTATAAIVGGQGEGADRLVIERTVASAWPRAEVLVSRPGNDPLAELQAEGDKALAEGAEQVRLQVNAVDTPDQRFGVDYHVGSIVAVEPWQGVALTDRVMTVHLQVWPGAGEVVSPTVGSQAATSDSAVVKRLREIDSRVGRLERTVMPANPP